MNDREEDLEDRIRVYPDGDKWCATRPGFTNQQECPVGFGDTEQDAIADLIRQEKED